jgi:hypothetical protein
MFVSPTTRSDASDENATTPPSAEIEGNQLAPRDWLPAESTFTRSVVCAWMSRTKMSGCWFVSPGTRFSAELANTMYLPSAEICGSKHQAHACFPFESTLMRRVTPLPSSKIPFRSGSRSCRKTSLTWFVSWATRFSAQLSKTTKRPSAESDGFSDSWSPSTPRRRHAHADDRAGDAVVDEDVSRVVRVARDQVVGVAVERDPAAVGGGSPESTRRREIARRSRRR